MISPLFYRGPYSYSPYYRYRPNNYSYDYNNYNRLNPNNSKKGSSDNDNKRKDLSDKKINISNAYVNNFKYNENESTNSKSSNDAVFEIFGIKLFFDDILLISLIFFLYNEGVKDKSLFIALILILLS